MLGRPSTKDEKFTDELRVELYEATFVDHIIEPEVPCIVERWLDLNDQPHRPNGLPAVTIRDKETGKIKVEEYWVHGQRHREGDKPAIIRTLDSGRDEFEWYYQDKLHREYGQPAQLEIDRKTDTPVGEHWYVHGKSMRPGGGLVCRIRHWTDEDGWCVDFEQWVDAAGLIYRDNEPVDSHEARSLTPEFP